MSTTTIPAREITVRRPGIDHEGPMEKYFVAGDPVRSHIAAMLSAVFPEGEDFFVEWDHAFGVEFAERDLQPGSLPGDLMDAVEFEVEQLADPQPACALHQECIGGESVGRLR